MKQILFFLCFFVSVSVCAAMETPTQYIQKTVDSVISVLTDDRYAATEAQDEKYVQLAQIVDTFFDAQELSRRALGQYWRLFDARQQAEFQTLFLELIKQVYLKKSITYSGEKVMYNQEFLKSESLAEVATTLVANNTNTSIIYYMTRPAPTTPWKVYDVSVENVSLIKNYRSQFQSILQNNPPEKLLAILREKTNE
ncbi:ABC transporter substrate-binding protein [Desulfovibrionales bacterium]